MKLYFLLLVLLISNFFAQENDSSSANPNRQPALLFCINELRLSGINGGAGMKWFVDESRRLIVTTNFSYDSDEIEKTERTAGSTETNYSIGITAGVNTHFNFLKDISPYFGWAVGFEFEKDKSSVNPVSYYSQYYKEERTKTSKIFSLVISFGAEYYITDNISLSGQYNLGGNYSLGNEIYETNYFKTDIDLKEWNLGLSSGELILAVYF